MKSPSEPAILAEITRGRIVESIHRGAIAVCTPAGRLIASAGNADFVTFLRSSAKPHQTAAAIVSGACRRFALDRREIALMSGSHSGESYHVECAAGLMAKLGLNRSALRCGIHTPFSRTAAENPGPEGVTELHNNCSGKHAGMLAQALHGGHTIDDYYLIEHPVQRRIAQVLAEFAGMDSGELAAAVDGCSVATFAMSVRRMALIYAKLVNPIGLSKELESASREVTAAMLEYPEMVAAETGRIDTDLMRMLPNRLIAKAGAEGVYTMSVLPCSRYPEGLGIALKVEDGDTTRARNAAIIGSLSQLGIIDEEQTSKLSSQYLPPIKSHRGIIAGEIRIAFKLS